MKKRALKIYLPVIILFSFLAGCVYQKPPIYTKGGKEYGKITGAFRNKWWNYYQRGLSYSDGQYYHEAVSDLKKAIHRRAKDQRMARTYGMHFIDYFPHRELGITYYKMRRLAQAKDELELSVRDCPSAKARFYLDRVRKDLIEKRHKIISSPMLELKLASRRGEVWTREDPVVLSGSARDENYVTAVTVMGRPIFLEGSQKEVIFSKKISLTQGTHIVRVVARNLLAKETIQNLVVHVDRDGPTISVEQVVSEQSEDKGWVVVSGYVSDESGVAMLAINGKNIPIQQKREVFFKERIIQHKGILIFHARDRLGNSTSAKIRLTASPTSRKDPVILACAGFGEVFPCMAGIFSNSNRRPPAIELRSWGEAQTVFLKSVYIEGKVTGESKITSVSINSMPIFCRKGLMIFFGHIVQLHKGENNIKIQATDEAGKTVSKEIKIWRKVPKAFELEERLSLAVFPFKKEHVVSKTGLSFDDNLVDALVNQDRFNMVERERLDVVLREQKISRTALVRKKTAIKLGRLVAAESVITGTITESRLGIEIVGRMIDTETSEIMAVEDVYAETKDLPTLRKLAEGMAIKFHHDFPLEVGIILKRKGKYIFTDLGKEKIKRERKIIIFKEQPIQHPQTGKTVGADHIILGRARIIQMMANLSKARITGPTNGAIGPMDKVITE